MSFREEVYEVVRKISAGSVASSGGGGYELLMI